MAKRLKSDEQLGSMGMIKTHDFTFRNRSIRVNISGKGSENLLLFHGFGQSGQAFNRWHRELDSTYTLYSFDLFFHGFSDQIEEPVTIDLWGSILRAFMEQNQITSFHLAGYSLGGRFVNATVKSFPTQVKSITYMAPDGFFESPWHRLAVAFQPIFRWTMSHPNALLSVAGLVEKARLTSPSLVKFAKRELRDVENRMRVYRSWVFLKPLLRSTKRIARVIDEHQIKCWVFLGSKDYIIPPGKVSPHFKNNSSALISVLEKRHHEIIDAAFDVLHCDQTEYEAET